MATEKDKALIEIKAKLNLKPPKKEFGLGDAIRAVTEALGIEHCDECERRRQRMNRWMRIRVARDEEEAKSEKTGT